MLNLDDPWLASALAVAVKAHIEAAPAEAANIRARAFRLKTVGDLAQYNKDLTPIVSNARAQARQQKVAARKRAALAAGKILATQEVAEKVQVAERLQ
jgi:hypothetical protein